MNTFNYLNNAKFDFFNYASGQKFIPTIVVKFQFKIYNWFFDKI